MKIISRYHNTEASFKPKTEWEVNTGNAIANCCIINKKQADRINKKLCGMKDCRCGGVVSSDWQAQPEHDGGYTLAKGVKL